jgi:anti-sigma-K factor RskA
MLQPDDLDKARLQEENQQMKKYAQVLLENAKTLQSIARDWRLRFLQLQTEQAEYRAQQEDSLWFRIGRRMGFYK